MTQDVGTGDSSEQPIRLGGALITMVEPHRGHEVAYNRWYERDHFYAGCMIGAWTVAGSRYVATRDLKALRYPKDSPICPDPNRGSYIAIYWILAGKFTEWLRWSTDQVQWLHENGRMFAARDHVHTSMYRFRSEYRSRADGVPVELALDHRSPYLVFLVGRPRAGRTLDDVDAFLRERALGEVAASFVPVPLLGDAPSDVPRTDDSDRFALLAFVDGEIGAVWESTFASLGRELAAADTADLLFVSPFRKTIVGTDTYTGELW
jgi:hypothetical protein